MLTVEHRTFLDGTGMPFLIPSQTIEVSCIHEYVRIDDMLHHIGSYAHATGETILPYDAIQLEGPPLVGFTNVPKRESPAHWWRIQVPDLVHSLGALSPRKREGLWESLSTIQGRDELCLWLAPS